MSRALRTLLASEAQTVLVEVVAVVGSAPREPGAWMLVSPETCAGTIGGGQLEFMAIDRARQLLRRGAQAEHAIVPLGPEIGQCCGGRVTLALTEIDAGLAMTLRRRVAADEEARPHVLIFGAGHVGRALAAALRLLPVRPILIDQRADELARADPGVETRRAALPEAEVAAAPPGSAFVILTHDHALDFLIADAALARSDAAYVGLIGSETKRARFRAWRVRNGARHAAAIRDLTCPIGGPSGDKRPEVIAAMTAAEIMTRLGERPRTSAQPAHPDSEVHDDDHDRTARN